LFAHYFEPRINRFL